MAFRSSTGNLGFYGDEPRRGGGGGGERWDRDRFERFGRRDPFDRFGDGDRDHFSPPRAKYDPELRDRMERSGIREHLLDDDRYERPIRRRPDFLDESSPADVANRALTPYRRKSIVERDVEISARRPSRPQYIRRQSSLDTFDRRPYPRYVERDEFRPPTNVPIPLPIRQREIRARRPSSPRRYREEQFEEIRYRDAESDHSDDYREVQVHRSRSRRRRSKAHRRARSSRSSSSSFEEVSPPREGLKRGKTRMPKRLVKKQAVIELGYPYEEEDDFIIVKWALAKHQIDEIIRISENYKESRTTYVYEDHSQAQHAHPPPPPESVRSPSPPPQQATQHRREVYEERVEESNHIGGPLTIVAPAHKHRSDREIKSEIRALEAEKRALVLEREAENKLIQADRIRESDYEIVDHSRKDRDVVRVERDRKAKPPNPKLIAAMMSTLT